MIAMANLYWYGWFLLRSKSRNIADIALSSKYHVIFGGIGELKWQF